MTPTTDRHPQRTMPKTPTRRELRSHPAVRQYTLFCMAALVLVVACLADRGLGWWSLMPALIGGGALLAQWTSGPALMLLSLTGLILAGERRVWRYPHISWQRDKVPALADLVLCVAVLAYVAASYRLLALVRHVFPPDPRRLPGSGFADPARRRSADLANVWEMVYLLLSLPLWTSLTVVIWSWIMDDAASLGMPHEVWRALRLVWTGLAIVAATAIVAGYLRRTLATPEESLLYLQDQLWRQTRREQGRLNRWLTWARLRGQRKRESS